MDDFSPSMIAETQKVAAREREGLGPHPAAAELLAYHRRELSEAASQQIRHHLALCPACTRAVLDLARFPEIEIDDPAAGLGDEEVAEGWRRLAPRLEARSPSGRGAPRLPLALAAGLALAVLGLATWNVLLHRQLEEGRTPEANVQVVELFPSGELLTRGDEARVVELLPGEGSVVVWLALTIPGKPAADYRAVVRDASGREIVVRRGLHPLPAGGFSFTVERRALPSGALQIDLFDPPEVLASYHLVIERAREP